MMAIYSAVMDAGTTVSKAKVNAHIRTDMTNTALWVYQYDASYNYIGVVSTNDINLYDSWSWHNFRDYYGSFTLNLDSNTRYVVAAVSSHDQ